MKRTIAFLLTVVLTLFCSITAFAAESNLDGEKRQTDIGVYARYIDNKQWNTVPVDENGQGTTVLPGGTEITVSGALKPGWQLAIDPITEKEAVDWIGGVPDGKAKDLLPLHIYFIDASGNIKTADSMTVTVKQPENPNAPVAYSLSSEGTASGMTVSMENGSLTFTTDGSPYYVLGEKDSGGTSPNGETPSDPGNSPQTGDTGRIWLRLAILMISGMVLFGIISYRKRKIRR